MTKNAPGLLEKGIRDKLVRESDGEDRFHADSPDFWKGIRELTRNGLTNIQLIASVAHNNETIKIFSLVPWHKMHIGNQEEYFTDLSILFKVVLQPQPTNYDDNLTDVIYGKCGKSDIL